jgi:hypothetical protein
MDTGGMVENRAHLNVGCSLIDWAGQNNASQAKKDAAQKGSNPPHCL